MFKKLMVCSALMMINISYAKNLNNYQQVVKAINKGSGIRLVIDFSQCKTNTPNSINVIGSIKPNAVMVIKNRYVTFSDLHFTTHHPAHDGMAVYESNKFKLTPENILTMNSEVLNPTSFDSLGNKFNAECSLNNGVSLYSVK